VSNQFETVGGWAQMVHFFSSWVSMLYKSSSYYQMWQDRLNSTLPAQEFYGSIPYVN